MCNMQPKCVAGVSRCLYCRQWTQEPPRCCEFTCRSSAVHSGAASGSWLGVAGGGGVHLRKPAFCVLLFLQGVHHIVRRHTTPHRTISMISYHTIPYHTTPYHITSHHTTPYHTTKGHIKPDMTVCGRRLFCLVLPGPNRLPDHRGALPLPTWPPCQTQGCSLPGTVRCWPPPRCCHQVHTAWPAAAAAAAAS